MVLSESVQSMNRQRLTQRLRAPYACALAVPSLRCPRAGTCETTVTQARESVFFATFSVELSFSAGGGKCFGGFALPHRQLSPHVHSETGARRRLLQQERLLTASWHSPSRSLARQQHRPSRTFVAEQRQLRGWPVSEQQASLSLHAHDAGIDCTGTDMAASQTRMRAAIFLVYHMASNPCFAPP